MHLYMWRTVFKVSAVCMVQTKHPASFIGLIYCKNCGYPWLVSN